MKFKGIAGEVTEPCPEATIGWAEISTLGIFPSVKSWKVTLADNRSRLMLAVNGLARVNSVLATPVLTILVGNERDASLIKFCLSPGSVTGDNLIWASADCKD